MSGTFATARELCDTLFPGFPAAGSEKVVPPAELVPPPIWEAAPHADSSMSMGAASRWLTVATKRNTSF